MTDQPPDEDDEALRWEGDDLDRTETRPRRRTVAAAPIDPAGPDDAVDVSAADPATVSSGALVLTGVLGGVFLLETLGWLRGVLGTALAATVTTGSGSTLELVVYALNVGGRVAAVAGAPLWFAVVLVALRGSRRIAWLVLGALLLVPWPALVHG